MPASQTEAGACVHTNCLSYRMTSVCTYVVIPLHCSVQTMVYSAVFGLQTQQLCSHEEVIKIKYLRTCQNLWDPCKVTCGYRPFAKLWPLINACCYGNETFFGQWY